MFYFYEDFLMIFGILKGTVSYIFLSFAPIPPSPRLHFANFFSNCHITTKLLVSLKQSFLLGLPLSAWTTFHCHKLFFF